MENLTFYGTDANLETSLFEYGLLVSNEEHPDGSHTHFCVYRMGDGYGTGHMAESEIDELLDVKSWASEQDLNGFFSYVGYHKTHEGYLGNDLATKISDLISYFGTENIMGTDYNPMTEEEARERYL